MRQLPPLPFHNKITVPATISGCKKKLKLQATNSILPSPGGLPQMMRSYQILVGLALISASSLRTRLANISYQTRTFFPLTLLKSLPPPSFKRVAGTSHFVLFKGADCGEKTPCLQIQMFKKKKSPGADCSSSEPRLFPSCTPRPSAGNQNGERVGGK